MTEELIQTVIVNLPNFLFAGLSIYTLYKINERLIAMIDRLCEPCKEDTGGEKE